MFADTFYETLVRLEKQVHDTQADAIQSAADKISAALLDGKVVHTFGIGHSFIPAKEAFFRKGGLIPVNPLYDGNLIGPFGGVNKIINIEHIEEYASIIFEGYEVESGEVLMHFSITGASPLTVEICREAQQRGLFVIAVTNVAYSKSLPSRHSSGKKLYEIADLVIDNCGEVGDAVVPVPCIEGDARAGATATITALMIWNMIFLQVIERYCEEGKPPPFIIPTGTPGAAERNERIFEQYRNRLRKHF